jgi:signal transduction histidine kinase
MSSAIDMASAATAATTTTLTDGAGIVIVPVVTPMPPRTPALREQAAPATRVRVPRTPKRVAIPAADHANHADTAADTAANHRARRKRTTITVPDTSGGSTEDAARSESLRSAPQRGRTTGGPRRGSGVQGLARRARVEPLEPEGQTLYGLPDPLLVALPALRQAILEGPLDIALRSVAEGLVLVLSPAVARIWIADVAPMTAWSDADSRIGGLELLPALTLRAQARSAGRHEPPDVQQSTKGDERRAGGSDPVPADRDGDGASSDPRSDAPYPLDPSPEPPMPDPLIADVAAARRPVVLLDADEHPLARAWMESGTEAWKDLQSEARAEDTGAPLATLGTLAAYPLRARGQLLGVVAVAATRRLAARQLAALEELADLAALAIDRDRLLSYSRGQEAVAQTVVRHAPVAMALISGPEYTLELANPAFAALLGLEGESLLAGRLLADVIGERARGIAASLRLDAAYAGDEPQAMIELPLPRDRRVTYWNVTTSPLAGIAGGGALVAGVEVTRQVMARQRAQESAEVAEVRVRQMMSLHATSLAVASQLGADPRDLLADLLRRSLALLNARAGAIYVRDPERDMLEVMVCEGLRRDYTGSRIQGGAGIAGQVAHTGRGLIVDDYRAYPFRAAIYDDEAFSAVIAVPLIHSNQVVGVLDVLDDAEQRTFTDDDLWLLELFAAQAAQAIQNARMYVELERAYRAQRELDRLKDDFIATASHELRTPLTGVQGFLDLLLDLPATLADPQARHFAGKAAAAAEELAEIAERLLQTSRLDTGRIELHLSAALLAPLVEDALRSVRELHEARGDAHQVVVVVPNDIWVTVDYERLKEVLDNLVSNALKYSPEGGRVVVDCSPAPFGIAACRERGGGTLDESPTVVLPTASLRPEAALPDYTAVGGDPGVSASRPSPTVLAAAASRPFVVLTVSDEGMGIAPQERSRLFGRFSRLDAARVSQIRGTGLGLYICRQLARAMGGDVWLLQSAPGQGSTFAVALPQAAPQQPAPQQGDLQAELLDAQQRLQGMRQAGQQAMGYDSLAPGTMDEPALVPALTPHPAPAQTEADAQEQRSETG